MRMTVNLAAAIACCSKLHVCAAISEFTATKYFQDSGCPTTPSLMTIAKTADCTDLVCSLSNNISTVCFQDYEAAVTEVLQDGPYILHEIFADDSCSTVVSAEGFLASGKCEQMPSAGVYVVAKIEGCGSATVEYFSEASCSRESLFNTESIAERAPECDLRATKWSVVVGSNRALQQSSSSGIGSASSSPAPAPIDTGSTGSGFGIAAVSPNRVDTTTTPPEAPTASTEGSTTPLPTRDATTTAPAATTGTATTAASSGSTTGSGETIFRSSGDSTSASHDGSSGSRASIDSASASSASGSIWEDSSYSRWPLRNKHNETNSPSIQATDSSSSTASASSSGSNGANNHTQDNVADGGSGGNIKTVQTADILGISRGAFVGVIVAGLVAGIVLVGVIVGGCRKDDGGGSRGRRRSSLYLGQTSPTRDQL